MRSEQSYINEIIGSSYVDVYAASYIPRYRYPNRLMHAGKAHNDMRAMCTRLIIDSAYEDEDMTNEDVLESALKQSADIVIPKDYPGEPERTRESLVDFLNRYQDIDGRRPEIMPVLQPPYVEHYEAHESFYQQFSRLAIGGLQSLNDPEKQVRRIRAISDAVSDHTYLHAFGVGTSLTMIRAIRNEPNLIDSFDTKTAEFAIVNKQIPDKEWKQRQLTLPSGTDISTVNGQFAKSVLLMANYMLTDRVDDPCLEETYHTQTNLDTVQDMINDIPAKQRQHRSQLTVDRNQAGQSQTSTTADHPDDSTTQSGIQSY
ncbi:hypothetical protein [Halorientalis regularis]|nr:hypothetical protein [Halorientalis regularis]